MSRLVARTLKEAGAEDAVPEFRATEGPNLSPPEPPGIHISIDPQMLEAGDIYNLVRTFSIDRNDEADYPGLVALRGRCFSTFDIE